jgi:hypothetical protein
MAALFNELRHQINAICDAGETRRENVQQGGDTREEKNRRERHLYDVRNAVERRQLS